MSDESTPRYALFGNTQTVAWEDAHGTIAWLAFPTADATPIFDAMTPSCGAGHFALEVVGPHTIERHYIGETGILQTLIQTPSGGRASMMDFLPVRPVTTPNGLQARVHNQRLVRVIECHAGEVTFKLAFAPRPDGVASPETEVDANGLLFVGERSSVILQSEAEVHLHTGGTTGEFTLKPQEKRHFVITWLPDADPDIPEVRATEADWEADGTIDFWLQWGRICPFQGVQRSHVLKLASLLKAIAPAADRIATPWRFLAPVALAAWGWEFELADALEGWKPDPTSPTDREQAAWLLWGLAIAQAGGLVEATLVVPHWGQLRPMVDALAQPDAAERLAVWVGLQGGLALADELLLDGDQAAWKQAAETVRPTLSSELAPVQAAAIGLGTPPVDEVPATDALSRCWRVRQELAAGGYLQARRLMDQLLQAYGPLGVIEGATQAHADPGELALVLWTAAEIYLQSAPTPGRVNLPGDLGD